MQEIIMRIENKKLSHIQRLVKRFNGRFLKFRKPLKNKGDSLFTVTFENSNNAKHFNCLVRIVRQAFF